MVLTVSRSGMVVRLLVEVVINDGLVVVIIEALAAPVSSPGRLPF
jgi:hypothetical protein